MVRMKEVYILSTESIRISIYLPLTEYESESKSVPLADVDVDSSLGLGLGLGPWRRDCLVVIIRMAGLGFLST